MNKVRLALCFKDFSYWTGYSSVGLNVAAHTTALELNKNGVMAEVIPVKHNIELFDVIRRIEHSDRPLTHVVIMAPWITPLDLGALVGYFPKIKFVVQSHCNIGGLHGDFRGMGNFRNYLDLALDFPNFNAAGNSEVFVRWLSEVYGSDVLYLPNLYPCPKVGRKEKKSLAVVKIGAFGALRTEKNFITAAGAALLMHAKLGRIVEFHMNSGGESKGKEIIAAINEMTCGIPGFEVRKHKWSDWYDFRRLVSGMDLLMQPSYTESFNMVTADGIAEGVPSVVSPCISWAPDSWKADPDNVLHIAEVGIKLLHEKDSNLGFQALTNYNKLGIMHWFKFLGVDKKHWWKIF